MEEYEGLIKLDTFDEITVAEYNQLLAKGANSTILTMCLHTIID